MSKQGEIDYPGKLPNLDWLHTKPFCDSAVVCGKELVRFGHFLRIMAPEPGNRILDVGVGPGWTSVFLAKMGYNVTGIDISPDMISIARKRAAQEGLHIEFEVVDIETGLPAEWPDRFDIVSFYDSLHHMDNIVNIASTCFNVLKPAGIVVLSEPNLVHPLSSQTKNLIRQYDVNERGFSWWHLRAILRKAGFVDVQRFMNPFRRPLTFGQPLDVLEGFFFGFLEIFCLSHWKTTILLKARKPAQLNL